MLELPQDLVGCAERGGNKSTTRRCTDVYSTCLILGCTGVHFVNHQPTHLRRYGRQVSPRPLPLSIMITQDRLTPPRFQSNSVVIDWSKETLNKKFDSASLLNWVQSFPSQDDVHIYLGNVSFHGDRILMRQLQAMGCTVTCRQYQS